MLKRLFVILIVALAFLNGCTAKTVLSGRNIYTLDEVGCECKALPAELTADDFMMVGKSWLAEEADMRIECNKVMGAKNGD